MTKPGLRTMRKSALWILLPLILSGSTQAWGMQPKEEKSVLPEGSKEYYSSAEVEELIQEITKTAEEEIEKTAIEAGKEAASEAEGDADYYRQLCEAYIRDAAAMERENAKLLKENGLLKAGLIAAGGISIGSLVFALICGVSR